MKIGRLRTGVLFVALGIALLLQSLDVIASGFWGRLFDLWPVLLIAIGLEKIFTATKNFRFLAIVSPVLVVGMVAYAAIGNSRHGDWSIVTFSESNSDTFTWSESGHPDTERLSITLGKAGGRLVIRHGAQEGNLIDGRLRYWGDKPDVSANEVGNVLRVEVEDRNDDIHLRDLWLLKLTDRLPVDVDIEGGATRMRLDFTDVQLTRLLLEAGAADIDLTLGTLSSIVECVLECGAASIDITIPFEAGLSVKRDGALSTFSSGGISLVERGSTLESPDFDSRAIKIRLDIQSGLSSIRIHRAADDSDDDGAI